ncbi:LysR substrate-binding domain-containing protein [Rhodobacteraceae bacterium nBUS_24]
MKGPPLNAIRAFEAAARTGSFAAAGRELAVTPAAVSQQVKVLETHWSRTLFVRQGNSIVLTDAGTSAYPSVAEALRSLYDISDAMQGVNRKARLVLSVPHSVAETWLPVLVEGWLSNNPNYRIDIRVDDDPIDFAGERVHARVFYGHSLYSDYKNEVLFTDEIVAVASKQFIERNGERIEDIPNHLLIKADWGQDFASTPDWSRALPESYQYDAAEGLQVTTSSVALSFAVQHIGIALVPKMMTRHLTSNGLLVKFNTPSLFMPRPYSVAYPHAISQSPEIIRLLAALTRKD